MIASDRKAGLPLSPVWRTYRAWRRVGCAAMLATFLVVPLEGIAHGRLPFTVAHYALMALAMVAIGRVGSFRCPRCGKWFHTRTTPAPIGQTNPFARMCLNCGLPRWTDP